MAGEEPPAKADEVIAEVAARKKEWELEDADVAKVRRRRAALSCGVPSGTLWTAPR